VFGDLIDTLCVCSCPCCTRSNFAEKYNVPVWIGESKQLVDESRGRSLPANASGFDTHRDSISSRFGCRSVGPACERGGRCRGTEPVHGRRPGRVHPAEAALVSTTVNSAPRSTDKHARSPN
jgi:hypothetical protein